MAKLVSATYGQALFELAVEKKVLDDIVVEVEGVRDTFLTNGELVKLLNHPKISKEEKIQVTENIFKGRVSDMIVGLLVTMIEKGRADEIVPVLEYFIYNADEYRHIGTAYVTSAIELSGEQKQAILAKLISTTKYSKFKMHYTVDKDIIAGLIIRIGDRVVDSSVKKKLENMSRELFELQI